MNQNFQCSWPGTVPGELPSPHHVHLWYIFLDINPAENETLLRHLSGDEVSRAMQFRFERDKSRFIAARGSLRRILGQYLQQEPHRIRFQYTTTGKPFLAPESSTCGIQFNLSHSDAVALCAVSLYREIGVDVERIRTDVAAGQIAAQFFSPNERHLLEQLNPPLLYETFFRYWARKEALLKATGDGLSFPMDKIDVSAICGDTFSPVPFPQDVDGKTGWLIKDLVLDKAYAAAIAVKGICTELTCFRYFV